MAVCSLPPLPEYCGLCQEPFEGHHHDRTWTDNGVCSQIERHWIRRPRCALTKSKLLLKSFHLVS